MTTSGTYNFNPSLADIALEALDRCEIRPPAITNEIMTSVKRSINLELERWSNLGVNLWLVDLQTINLVQGVTTYSIPPETVSILDVYIRTFSLTNTFNVPVSFSIVSGSPTITVAVANHGLQTGNFVNILTQIGIGNLMLYGFYEVASVVNSGIFTITAYVNATSTINNGGSVPLFTPTAGSSLMKVTLANHGLANGQLFNVAVQTIVAGVILFGSYTVVNVIDASNFTMQLMEDAGNNTSVSENMGQLQLQTQSTTADPVDRIMTPMGRTDYAMQPDKFVQATPTQYWFDRLINPQITMWPVPDQNGPYQLQYYRMRRIQDASPTMGQTAEIPYRFIDAFCARLAHRLAIKYAKTMLDTLSKEADRAWNEAAIEDRERADIFIMPMLDLYYRDT